MPRTLTPEEFQAVRKQVLDSAPPNLDPATFTRWFKPQLAAAVAEAELKPPMQEDSAAWRFASNLASGLNPIAMAKGVWNAAPIPQFLGGSGIVAGPVNAATGIAHDMADQGRQAIDAAHQGHYSEAVGHGGAAMIPVVGPQAAHVGEQFASGDIAGGAGATTAMLAPFAATEAVRAVRAAAPTGVRNAVADSLDEGAANRYTDVMTPKVGPNKTRLGNQAAKVAPELAKNPDMAAWSREGLQANVQAALDNATSMLDQVADERNVGKAFDTAPIVQSLEEARSKLVAEPVEASHVTPQKTNLPPTGEETNLTRNVAVPIGKAVEPAPNASRIAAIDQVISEVKQLGPMARYESLRRIRQAWDQVAKPKYAPAVTADYLKVQGEASGAADATAALREHLASFDPATDAANQQYSLYKKANDVLAAAQETERVRPKAGRALVARLAGTIFGAEKAGAAGAAAGYILGPTVDAALSAGATTKLMTGQLMTKLAAAIRAGDATAAESLAAKLKRFAEVSPSTVTSAAKKLAPTTARGLAGVTTGSQSPTPTAPDRAQR